LDLSQLEAALNPGTGGAMGNFQLDSFAVSPDVAGELMIFSIADLDSRPKPLRRIMPQFPPEFIATGPKGVIRVRIMIDETGSVTVMEVVEATHQEVVQPVRQALIKWKFEAPRKDGEKVRAQYIQPIPYDYSG
jgi:protein TonB